MKRAVLRIIGLGIVFCMMSAVAASIVAAADYDLSWFTVDGGGGTSSGGTYELTGTIGQADATAASAITGGGYALTGGFWSFTFQTCTTFSPADFNQDCFVDGNDLAIFNACLSGPSVALVGDCAKADFDHDGDVDMDDFGIFQRCYSGTGKPANPNCAG